MQNHYKIVSSNKICQLMSVETGNFYTKYVFRMFTLTWFQLARMEVNSGEISA